jgi:DNA-binding NtrC family response regulator
MIASPEVLRELVKRPWLGNVRELRNFVHRATAVGAREALMSMPSTSAPRPSPESPAEEATAAGVSFDSDYRTFRQQWIERGEREYFGRLLSQNNRNVAAAAKRAGVDRTYVYRLIRELSL